MKPPLVGKGWHWRACSQAEEAAAVTAIPDVMLEFYRDGRARPIGVSNFQPHHLRRLDAECEVPRRSTRSRSTPT